MFFKEPVIELIEFDFSEIVTATSNLCQDAYAGGGNTCSNNAYNGCTTSYSRCMAGYSSIG